jgi:hypothetical protein
MVLDPRNIYKICNFCDGREKYRYLKFRSCNCVTIYYQDFSKTMPRSEVEAIFDRIQKVLNKIDSGLVATLCGAYRDG